MWPICTLDDYPAVKKNGIMIYAGKWMEIEKKKPLISSEVIQAQKNKHPTFSLVCKF